MTISKEINCAEYEYMNIGPYRSSGAPAMAARVMLTLNKVKTPNSKNIFKNMLFLQEQTCLLTVANNIEVKI